MSVPFTPLDAAALERIAERESYEVRNATGGVVKHVRLVLYERDALVAELRVSRTENQELRAQNERLEEQLTDAANVEMWKNGQISLLRRQLSDLMTMPEGGCDE